MRERQKMTTEQEHTPCADCGAMVHWLERFPQNRCLPCHARTVEGESPEETLRVIVGTFGK
jgi:hypothetical protein